MKSVREGYEQLGVKGFYETHGSTYTNPHYSALCSCLTKLLDTLFNIPRTSTIAQALLPFSSGEKLRIFDLACGSGEATRALIQTLPRVIAKQQGLSLCPIAIEACDPYTLEALNSSIETTPFPASVTLTRTHSFTFEDMNDPDSESYTLNTQFHITICSFALHLAGSTFHGILTELSKKSRLLIVLGPGKKVVVERRHGWNEVCRCMVDRVHGWVYESIYF